MVTCQRMRHQRAPSTRADSKYSSLTLISRARQSTTPKPSSFQMMTNMMVGIAQAGLPSQSCARKFKPIARSAVLSTPLILEDVAEDDADDGDRQDIGDEEQRAVDLPAARPVEEDRRDQHAQHHHDRDAEEELQIVEDAPRMKSESSKM